MLLGLGNVPFDENSLNRFSDKSKVDIKFTFDNCRMIKNELLEINSIVVDYDTLMSYNYGFYAKNEDSKKYYFFINGVEYVNDNVNRITISIDWFTTDFTVGMLKNRSFIERIHPVTKDSDFTQIPESVNYDQWEFKPQFFKPHTIDKYIIGCNFGFPPNEILSLDSLGDISTPFTVWQNCPTLCGVPQGCVYYVLDDIQKVYNVYANAVNFGYTSGITGIWRVASDIIGDSIKPVTGQYYPMGVNIPSTKINFDVDIIGSTDELKLIDEINIINTETFGNYRPTYKKLQSDEFKQVYVQNDKMTTFYNPSQLFDENLSATFGEFASVDFNMQVTICPKGYKNSAKGDGHYNFSDGITSIFSISGVLTADNTQQEINNIAVNSYGKVAELAVNAYTGNGAGALSSAKSFFSESFHFLAGGMSNNVTTIGSNSSNYVSAQLPTNSKYFYLGFYKINEKSARLIDKYFSMYGYAVNEVMTPYLRLDSNYTYIKGKINFKNDISDISRKYIDNLFSQGLTIWTDDIYQYDV